MATQGNIHVAIVEDDRGTREGLAILIDGAPGYRCVGSYGSVEAALPSIVVDAPDVLLLDINLPGMPGSQGARVLRERLPSVQILMLTVYAEQELIFDSICNGACGYLLKTTPPNRLLEAIRELREGGAPMSPEVARKVVVLFQKTSSPQELEHRLTAHELRLLKFLAEGYSYLALAEHFHISVNTVRNYIRSIYEKLHVHSKSEAVGKALRNRLIV
jgi:DNA-binding NarL/FixJ family response regulator